MYDIAIVGLGPAGATLARRLDERFSIAAIDAKSSDAASFRKPCGGLLAPDAQKALARFDLTLPKDVLVDPQIFSVRTIDLDAPDGASSRTRYYQRFYVNIDRHRFDLWLMEQIPARVERFHTECRRIERIPGGFRLELADGRQIDARRVVGADGAKSLVRRTFFPQKKFRRYVAIQQWFPETHAAPFYSCVFDSRNTDCYSWSISKDGYFIFGGAYPAQGCRERFERQKQKLSELGFRFGTPLKTEGCQVLRPASPSQFCTGREGVFLIGEAAGFVSPSSLEGISSALLSGDLLAHVLNRGGGEREYRRATRKLRRKLSGKLLKCPAMYWRSLRRLVMRSGLQSIEVEAGARTN